MTTAKARLPVTALMCYLVELLVELALGLARLGIGLGLAL